ncbi:MAG TPA: ABC transporter substrate-binding protein [Thermomicrobiales bacterium]|nr:ABC transporter substrate-binding protein [Thermomicrobiales bacterium]
MVDDPNKRSRLWLRPAAPNESERTELDQLWNTLQRTAPRGSRRDFMRWSAVIAGAVATARFGVGDGEAASGSSGAVSSVAFQNADIEKDVTISVPFNPYGQPVTLDPHFTVNWGPFWVVFPNVWGGLVRYDENGKVVRDLSESHTVSDDGLVYTFKIRSDAKYASGNKVVANDFISSWKRALDPSRPSPMAEFMQLIDGYDDYLAKKSDKLGIRAVDDATVEVTLSKPYSYFLSYMASFVWSVIDPAVLKKEGDGFTLKDAGTGPWRFTSFDAASKFVMEPNTNHYGGNSPSIAKIEWPFITGPSADSTALNQYKKGDVISCDVPLSLKSSVERDPELSKQLVKIEPYGSTRSLAMDFSQEPFNDVRVRRAFAMAIDRDKWANDIWEGTWAATSSFTPPVVTTLSEYKPPAGISFDAAGAKKLLAEAGFENGKGLPEITYYEPAEDSDDEQGRWRSFLDMIQENLGVQVVHDTSKTLSQIQDLQTDNGGRQFDIVWWWNITETPHLLSEVFASSSPYMKGVFNWNSTLKASGDFDPGADSKQFDDLVTKADTEKDAAARNDLYQKAETLALKNAVYVPLGNWIQMYVQQPWVQGTKQGPWTGRLPVIFDKDVVVSKH